VTLQLGSHPRLRSVLSAHAIFQHEKPDPDQQQRHKKSAAPGKIQKIRNCSAETARQSDQNNRSQRPLPAPVFKGSASGWPVDFAFAVLIASIAM